MSAPMVRKAVWTLAAALLLAVVVVVSLPLVASTQIVRARIAQQLGEWSGYQVTLGSAPDIEVWPSFRAVLNDISFVGPDADWPVLEADEAVLHLSALSAIGGDVDFSRIDLIRPVLRVSRAGVFLLPKPPPGGEVRQAIESFVEGRRAGGAGSLGTVTFTGGRIVRDGGAPAVDIVSSLAGQIEWRQPGAPASINAGGIWRGEQVSVAVHVERPQDILGGSTSPARLSLKSQPLTLEYRGAARLQAPAAIDGNLTLSSPSLRRVLEWTEVAVAPGATMGELSASGRLDGSGGRIKLSEAAVSLGGHQGAGALELSAGNGVPAVAGTLAFDTLDIGMLLAAFTASDRSGTAQPAVFDLAFTDRFNLDLRLSAASATGGPVAMTEVAASAQVKPGLAAFDISDATAFGGVVQASLRMDRKPEGNTGELRFSATDIEWAALASTAGWTKVAPAGRGALAISMRGPATDWASLARNASGTLSASLGPGQITGIDLPALISHKPGSGFYPLGEVSQGAIAVESAEVKATLAGGTARIDKAIALTANEAITLAGIVPYAERGLALSGSIQAREGRNSGLKPSFFFVGGSWRSPFVSPTLPIWAPE